MGIARIAWPMSDAWFSRCEARASRSRNGSNRVTIPTTSRGTVGAGPGGPAPSRKRAEGDGHANLRDAHVLALSPRECQVVSTPLSTVTPDPGREDARGRAERRAGAGRDPGSGAG